LKLFSKNAKISPLTIIYTNESKKKQFVTELLFVFTKLFITALAMLIWDRFAERNRGEFMGEG